MNFVFQKLHHPATFGLLRIQSRAKLNRIVGAFRNPRRQVLSIVAAGLGFIWLSQAVASVMFRHSADPQKLMTWLPLALFVYSLWHLVKTVTRKPVEPFEWTPAENELIRTAPITRTQLISYRMASILSSALIKALCFSVVMIPDLSFWAAGLIGMFLGLILVDLIRVCFELLFHGLAKRGRVLGRIGVLGLLAICVCWGLLKCLTGPQAAEDIASPGSLIFLQRFVGEMIGLTSTSIGAIVLLPFKPFSKVILADQLSGQMLGYLGLSLLMVVAAAIAVYRLDAWVNFRTQVKERKSYQRGIATHNRITSSSQGLVRRVSIPWRIGGLGSLAWRQLMGAYHYRMALVFSLGVPTILCCIPLLAKHDPFFMLANVVGGVVFYSFLLLPSALMLDFRRDVNRIVVLKGLPIGPVAMTIGQLATPILICSAFQWIVLVIATITGSVIGWQALIAALLLLPINTLIFAIENFIFLLAPFRRNQEGLDVFLRTILTFTAKGVLFAAGLAATVAWAFTAKFLGSIWSSSPVAAGVIFGVGGWLMTFALAASFVYGIVRLYDRFDPSQDAPAVS